MNQSTYCDWLARASMADVNSVRTTNSHRVIGDDGAEVVHEMPLLDADARVAAMQAALPRMYAAAQNDEFGGAEELEGISNEELDSFEL